MAFEKHNEEIFFGRPATWSGVYDFYLDPSDAQVKVRKLLAGEIGNPGQIFLRRVGPDNVPHDYVNPAEGKYPERPRMGDNIGHIAWQGYEGTDLGFPPERNAQIYARYYGLGTGSLIFQTSGKDRIVINADGSLDLSGCADESGRVPVSVNGRRGYLEIKWENND